MFKKNKFFVGVLKVNGEKSRIRIRIRIHLSEACIRGSGSTPKCHGSATLQPGDRDENEHTVRDVLPRWGNSMNGLMASRERQRWCPMKVDIRPLDT